MTRSGQSRGSVSAWLVITVGLFILLMTAVAAQAQTYTVVHKFSGSDGERPTSTLVLDRAGNFYGTAENGGTYGYGVLFQLKASGSGWILRPLHYFGQQAGNGYNPLDYGGLTFGPDGALYGSASSGGLLECFEGQSYCGALFRLQPPATACKSALCLWDYSLIYQFTSSFDSGGPETSLVFDAAGNLYGTGLYGTIYELSPSGGGWNESSIYQLDNYTNAGMIMDSAGNLYGTWWSYDNNGGVFELSPSSSGWTETVLYSFTGGSEGSSPLGGLIFDSAGHTAQRVPGAAKAGERFLSCRPQAADGRTISCAVCEATRIWWSTERLDLDESKAIFMALLIPAEDSVPAECSKLHVWETTGSAATCTIFSRTAMACSPLRA